MGLDPDDVEADLREADEALRLEQDRASAYRSKSAKLRAALLDLLEAPYLGGPAPALAKTNACYELGHVKRETGACYCGRRNKP